MSTSARLSLSLVSIVLIAAAIVGCGKKEEDAPVLAMPSATAIAPVKATQDPTPAPAGDSVAAAGSAGGDVAATPPPPATTEPVKTGPAPSIDGCCSALSAMTKDAKLDAVTKSKATAAAGMCGATAKLVKEGKASRSTALTQIRATMAGKAPSACN